MSDTTATPVGVTNEPGVWYMTWRTECPMCGRYRVERERRPPPAPPKNERYEFANGVNCLCVL